MAAAEAPLENPMAMTLLMVDLLAALLAHLMVVLVEEPVVVLPLLPEVVVVVLAAELALHLDLVVAVELIPLVGLALPLVAHPVVVVQAGVVVVPVVELALLPHLGHLVLLDLLDLLDLHFLALTWDIGPSLGLIGTSRWVANPMLVGLTWKLAQSTSTPINTETLTHPRITSDQGPRLTAQLGIPMIHSSYSSSIS